MKNNKQLTKVAVAQVVPVYLNKEETIRKACLIIEEAAKKGAKLIVFPEAFIPGYPDWVWLIPNSRSKELNELYVELAKNSLSIDDTSTLQVCKTAGKNNIHVALGINEINSEASGASLYNSLLFIDNKGKISGVHRKLIPTGGERLVWARGNGDSLHTFDTSIGKLGGLICWENYMPMARQVMYDSGTQILAAPTWDKSDNWLLSLRHIAREGGMFVLGCCAPIRKKDIPDSLEFKKLYPEEKDWINTGNSCIINPKGEFLAGPLDKKEDILYADLDMDEIIAAKRMFDPAGHYSRPDVFKLSVNRDS
ncbi:MAG: carbon-nitrogen hydrolase family protein [Acidobacteriota bacterium]